LVKLRDAPEAIPNPVTLTDVPATNELFAVKVVVVPFPTAAVTVADKAPAAAAPAPPPPMTIA
jgi:hypothetical protein